MASLEEEMEVMMSSSKKKVNKYKKEHPRATNPRPQDLQRAKEHRNKRARDREFYNREKPRLSKMNDDEIRKKANRLREGPIY